MLQLNIQYVDDENNDNNHGFERQGTCAFITAVIVCICYKAYNK